MTILLSDPRVAAIPVIENGEPLVELDAFFGRNRAVVRAGLAARLADASALLPAGISLRVVEGHRYVAGAAVDLTLVDATGEPLDLGTPIDATPEQSGGRCYFGAGGISPDARAHRDLLAEVLGASGLVNYPTEWWHWSYGDRYWALLTGAPAALYGPALMTSERVRGAAA
ncbi:MAG: dipeptidase [Marmoricola sp.]|nr:dipeptidase [Marmoricola sp.]